MDIKDLRLLIKLVTETDITEFEMDNSEEKIVIKRGHKPEYVTVAAPASPQYAPPGYHPVPVAPEAAPSVVSAPVVEAGDTVNSPIVGTFYAAPGPEEAPYVTVGQIIEKGQVLCIVEAMKLMNEIEADCKCKIVKICKDNAQAVEFGDPLFVIQKL
ncbi:MAG: acetyl-CoA carboxylase biotin carboxyl carrier protein [Desulfuromonadaceae bacterium]|nr:acetyl-CoA carboxylase biotin carboxyl carrier protein [Desulfuromonadaceae bacterium]MDD5107097.1 acetyl-CoA carboxylase biotin carboxyl carrier protein [Desulfuromonadaceae bacterium]